MSSAPLTASGAPSPLYPGEVFSSVHRGAYFALETLPSPYSGHGTLYLSATRLVLVLVPAPPPSDSRHPRAVQIPLSWLSRPGARLSVARPFFDTPHVSGTLVAGRSGLLGAAGARVPLRLQVIAAGGVDTLFAELCDKIKDENSVREAEARLRAAEDAALVPVVDGGGVAFYDPARPGCLILARALRSSLEADGGAAGVSGL
jgi:hypothetical protein